MNRNQIKKILDKWCVKVSLEVIQGKSEGKFNFKVPSDSTVYIKPSYKSRLGEEIHEYSRGFDIAVVPTTRNLALDLDNSLGHVFYKELHGIAVIPDDDIEVLVLVDINYDVSFIPYNQIAYMS